MRLSWFKKQLTKLMHINQTPEDVPKSTIKVESGESPILVFVSSIQTDELQEARDITTRTIRSFLVPEATVWAFEYTPAASEKPDKNYLRKVRQCDIFIWLVGRTTSIPVRNEIHEAIAANRHKLVFALFEERDTETEELLKKVGESAKYQETSLKELSRQILLAIGDMFTRAVRDKPDIGLEAMLDEMERRSKGRCISSWQSIGIPSDVATKLSEDSRVGEPTVEMFPSVEQPVILI